VIGGQLAATSAYPALRTGLGGVLGEQ